MEPMKSLAINGNSLRLVLCLTTIPLLSGCGTSNSRRKIESLQAETDRVVSQYQAEKRRADELAEQNRELVARLEESKPLSTSVSARQNPSTPLPATSQVPSMDHQWQRRPR